MKKKLKKEKTGWGSVATWYDKHLENDDTYHAKVVFPNLARLVDIQKGQSLLELGCGQGYFLEKFFEKSELLTGVDIGIELIEIARKKNSQIEYIAASADAPALLAGRTYDRIIIVLALQNMKNINEVVSNISRLLADNGRAYVVLNHPAFRVPQYSGWSFDTEKNRQSRRVDAYLTSMEIDIDMNPGQADQKNTTTSFHRPLQVYSKAFSKNGLAITKLEEWISHKESQPGPRAIAENKARKEFPLFLCVELRKFI